MKDRLEACWYILTKKKFMIAAYDKEKVGETRAVTIFHNVSKTFGLAMRDYLQALCSNTKK